MKQIALTLLCWTLRKLLKVSRQLWQDLEARVRMADSARAADDRPLTAEEKHADVDIWLSGMELRTIAELTGRTPEYTRKRWELIRKRVRAALESKDRIHDPRHSRS